MLRPAAKFDEASFRNAINAGIERDGFELEFAFNGDAALTHYCDHGPYDLVLTDIFHPGMDGIDLAREILRKNPQQAIAVFSIYLSGSSLEALWKLGIPVADKLDSWEALSLLVEEAVAHPPDPGRSKVC